MNTSVIFLAIAFVWIIQLMLSLLQTKRFHKRVTELRKMGPATSVGFAGKNWTMKQYGVLVMDDERNVVQAEKLAGVTVFSSLKDVPQLKGLSLIRLLQDEPVPGVSKKLWAAFQNAADYIRKHDIKIENEREDEEEVETRR